MFSRSQNRKKYCCSNFGHVIISFLDKKSNNKVIFFCGNFSLMLVQCACQCRVISAMDLIYNGHAVQHRMISGDNFLVFLRSLFFCCVVAICDLVHAVEATYSLP